MSDSIPKFVKKVLYDLSDEYNIPKSFIPQLVAIIERYPDVTIRGKKKELQTDLRKVIGNLKDQGLLG